MSMGEQIRAMRQIRGLTQKELAERLGISAVGIAQWENGLRCPKIETLKRIADALEMPVGAFLPAVGIGESFGTRVRSARKKQKLTLEQLGLEMGISGSLVGRYERNVENPKPDTIKRFADALGVDANWLEKGEYGDNSLSGDEQQLLRYFRTMSPEGQRVALERMDELSQHPKYKRRV